MAEEPMGGPSVNADVVAASLAEADAKVDAAMAADNEPITPPEPVVPDAPVPVVPDPAPAAVASPTPAQPESPSYSEATLALLQQYGGDVNKVAERFWELARTAELAQKPQTPEAPTAPVVSPQIQQFDSRLSVLNEEFVKLDTEFSQVLTKKAELESQREEVIRGLSHPDADTDIAALTKSLRKIDSDLGRVRQREEYIKSRGAQIHETRQTLDLIKNQALPNEQLIQARELQEQAQYAAQVDGWRGEFDTALDAAGSQVPPGLKEEFEDYARAKALKFVQGPDRPVISDVKSYTLKLAKDFTATLDKHHRAKSAEYSLQKQQDANPGTPKGNPVAPQTKKPLTPKDWDAHLEQAEF